MERPAPGKVEDLATLAKLDDQVLLEELKIRYSNHDIYTYVGDILIAVNPYRDLGIYGNEVSGKYFLEKKSANPPHIFAVADTAYQCIVGYGGRIPTNQCILISGESGAGKTESTKLIIKQIIDLCRGNTQLEQQILQVNPLLEAFGNAQTQMNDNSSRFGKYLSNGASCLKREQRLLKSRYEDLINAMDLVGFTDEEQNSMFNIIASILHLGNVTFGFDDHDAAYVQDENGDIKIASKLLGINCEELVGTLTSMVTFTAGEQVKRNYTQQRAEDARDATAKAIYGRMFGWIVNKINQLLAPRCVNLNKKSEIGILDIFGFEHFEKNSFEQACINLANEQLQFFFNQHVFKLEQEEYIKEGIDWNEIKFVDNQPLLNLFLNKPIGVLSLLDEESHFPKGTDASFVDKLNTHFKGNSYYVKSQQTKSTKFTINHYAGKVTYDAENWLEKNRDTLPHGVMEMLQCSSNDLVKLIFRGQITRTGTLALQARKSSSNSLQILMEKMTSASPVFVRCLKPNHVRAPGSFNEKYIKDQLLYTGMLETTKIRREGFAVRPSFTEFVDKYKIILKTKLYGDSLADVNINDDYWLQGRKQIGSEN
ncbi:hypothetical protein KUTeg_018126 [Tegillarca granosa]|uniref:Myosin motor domain-containing protein n=1 Tax=Tegillarca granosa TaxID=220873 RepID=A0ABQ9EMQ4_TEGGR|nr:hypothetical protein KUTeg_018126 [Tegillarca granosa]